MVLRRSRKTVSGFLLLRSFLSPFWAKRSILLFYFWPPSHACLLLSVLGVMIKKNGIVSFRFGSVVDSSAAVEMFADKADLVRVHCYAIILPYFLQDESKSKAKFGQVIFEDDSLWKAPVVEEKFTKISLAANVTRKTFCVLRLTLPSADGLAQLGVTYFIKHYLTKLGAGKPSKKVYSEAIATVLIQSKPKVKWSDVVKAEMIAPIEPAAEDSKSATPKGKGKSKGKKSSKKRKEPPSPEPAKPSSEPEDEESNDDRPDDEELGALPEWDADVEAAIEEMMKAETPGNPSKKGEKKYIVIATDGSNRRVSFQDDTGSGAAPEPTRRRAVALGTAVANRIEERVAAAAEARGMNDAEDLIERLGLGASEQERHDLLDLFAGIPRASDLDTKTLKKFKFGRDVIYLRELHPTKSHMPLGQKFEATLDLVNNPTPDSVCEDIGFMARMFGRIRPDLQPNIYDYGGHLRLLFKS
eukprot:g19416.t1